jgi:hypothetical protein
MCRPRSRASRLRWSSSPSGCGVGPPTPRVDDLVIEELLDLNPPPQGFRIE